MAKLNKVFLIGNLTRDPELRYVPSGSAVTNFTIATNRTYTLQSGEKKEEVCYVRIVVWGRIAEICGEYLSKGSPVFVEGRLQSRSWETPQGEKRSTLEVIAQNVQFLGRGKGVEAQSDVEAPNEQGMLDIPFEEGISGQKRSKETKENSGEEVPF